MRQETGLRADAASTVLRAAFRVGRHPGSGGAVPVGWSRRGESDCLVATRAQGGGWRRPPRREGRPTRGDFPRRPTPGGEGRRTTPRARRPSGGRGGVTDVGSRCRDGLRGRPGGSEPSFPPWLVPLRPDSARFSRRCRCSPCVGGDEDRVAPLRPGPAGSQWDRDRDGTGIATGGSCAGWLGFGRREQSRPVARVGSDSPPGDSPDSGGAPWA